MERNIFSTKIRWVFAAVMIALVLDRGTKWFAQTKLPEEGISFVFGFVKFSRYVNEAAAFSLSVPKIIILTLTNFILLIVLWFLLHAYRNRDILRTFALALIFVGGLSNVVDRAFYGGVVDFFTIGYLPVINVADCVILVGLFLLMKSLNGKPA